MMNWKLLSILMPLISLLGACHPQGKVITIDFEQRNLDTVSVVASKKNTYKRPSYHPSYTRRNDLLHTSLDIHFDWEKQHVHGKAKLDLQALFYPTDSLRLDAKGFDIHKINLLFEGTKFPVTYKYEDNKNLYINLNRSYTAEEKYQIYIEYTAKPNELPIGGSDAITEDKGLYFINPLGEDPNKPQQIWTQGETESSSCWFPCIDRPNERCTQEIYLTVQDRFKTLSNGLLSSSTPNKDGTRTDYWVMNQAHAPYLFMLAVGEFSVIKEDWNGMPLEYYVEEEYAEYAKDIFNYTGEMLSFFSNKLGLKYPWQKYSQVIVRDFVSGAMENTTGVIFGDFVQMTDRELLDHSDGNESIVAHEMMHHWFGDLVTCESWANLPLNESFANYGEYLWFEHKYGKDAADYIRMNEFAGYIAQAVIQGDQHPLIFFSYKDKEDMFDSHSYNKGGMILHMLRNHLGDKAFFEGLKIYLQIHQYSSVESNDLRLIFEKITGQDLNWFFDQWFFTSGHPSLEIRKHYDEKSKTLHLNIEQTQDINESTVFILPIDLEIYMDENTPPIKKRFWFKQQEKEFTIQLDKAPKWLSIDPSRMLLCERIYDQNREELIFQYKHSTSFQNRYEAIRQLQYDQKAHVDVHQVYIQALEDPFWAIRAVALDAIKLDFEKDQKIIEKIQIIARKDPRPDVRVAALQKIGHFEDSKYANILLESLNKDMSYRVISAAMYALYRMDKEKALTAAANLESISNPQIIMQIADIYARTADKKYLSFYEKNWNIPTEYSCYLFFDYYGRLLVQIGDWDLLDKKADWLMKIAMDENLSLWGRYGASSVIKKIREVAYDIPKAAKLEKKVDDMIKKIKAKEMDPTLVKLYKEW